MGWLRRLHGTLFPSRIDCDLADETAFHLEALIDEHVARGISPDEARRLAHRRLGSLALVHERSRDAETFRWIGDFGRDLRYAWRGVRKNPAVATAAILTFALGIGANAAIFGVFDAVVLQSLPVPEPERLVLFSTITGEGTQTGNPPRGAWPLFSTAAYDFLRQQPLPFEALAAVRSGETPVAVAFPGATGIQRAQAHLVSGNYFDTLRVDPWLGRRLTPDDDRPGSAPAAVVSYGFWRGSLRADPAAIGLVVTINRTPFTVVGVAPPEFFGERMRRAPDLWVPLTFQPEIELRPSFLDRADAYWLTLIARLRPGADLGQAETTATTALRQFLTGPAGPLAGDQRTDARDASIALFDGRAGISGLREKYDEALRTLLFAVGFVLLMACANVASLLLSRAAARRDELALRLALGAGRWRLFRQFLAEHLILAVAGAAIGVGVSRWAMDALLIAIAGTGSPIRVALDGRVLFVSAAATMGAALLFGVMPAWTAGRRNVAPSGRIAGRGWTARFGSESLVVGQLALSLVLVVGAGLLARSLLNLQQRALGFVPDRVTVVRAFPRLAGYTPESAIELYRRLYERLNAGAGIRHATLARYSPFSGGSSHQTGAVEGYTPADGEPVNLEQVMVGPSFPETLGLPLRRGRSIDAGDTMGRPKVGMVNEAFVRRFFPSTDPIGRRFGVSGSRGTSGPTDIEIVGVVGDAPFHDPREVVAPMVFTALWQSPTQSALDVELQLQTAEGSGLTPADLRRLVAGVDAALPLDAPRALSGQVHGAFSSDRLAGQLVASFSLLALLLAAVGLHGVLAQAVVRRAPEIGVRIALGATRRQITWLFLRYTLVLLCAGLLIGIPLSLAGGRLVASQLYGVGAADAAALVTGILTLSGVAVATGFLPARRAGRVDPLRMIRSE